MKGKNGIVAGIDLGGTKILAAVFKVEEGKKGEARKLTLISSEKAKTPREASAEAVIDVLGKTAREALAAAGITASALDSIGVAVPGPLNRRDGIVLYTPNMGFEKFPLAARLGSLFDAPVYLDNDVQSGVFGELRSGALRGMRDAVGIFVGTGIGGGLILDGKIFRGSSGSAGEIGHMILLEGGPLCGCGNYGCLEALASRTALTKDAIGLASAGKAPGLLASAGTDFRKCRSSSIEESIQAGDTAVAKALDRTAHWLGIGMANVVHLFNPEAIVLGGGVMERFGQRIRETARKSMEAHLMPGLAKTVEVLVSELGDFAVATGAAHMALESGGAR